MEPTRGSQTNPTSGYKINEKQLVTKPLAVSKKLLTFALEGQGKGPCSHTYIFIHFYVTQI